MYCKKIKRQKIDDSVHTVRLPDLCEHHIYYLAPTQKENNLMCSNRLLLWREYTLYLLIS
jgi:hypothetical protein